MALVVGGAVLQKDSTIGIERKEWGSARAPAEGSPVAGVVLIMLGLVL